MTRWLGALLLAATAASGCSAPADDRPDADEEVNKKIVRQFVAAMNARDLDALDSLVAPDLVRESPSTPDVSVRSLEDFKEMLRRDLAGVPDARQEIRRMIAEGDEVAVWANYSGTQTGPMGPYPASGRPVDLDFAGFLRIEDGRIAEIHVVWDNLSMLTELGHLARPGG